MNYSTNLLLNEPTPGDPAVKNTWGVVLNTNDSLLDSAVAGILPLSVAGSSNVVLTSNSGAADQSRNQQFTLSGVLTGNIYVLWPNGRNRMFSITNNTTGAFTLSAAVNNGSGSPAGTSVSVLQGDTVMLYSNGTDVKVRAAGTLGSFTNISASGTLSVTGASTLTGTVSMGSTLSVTGDVAINTNKFNITASSGNTTIAGTLGVTGAITSSAAITGTSIVPSSTAIPPVGLYLLPDANNLALAARALPVLLLSNPASAVDYFYMLGSVTGNPAAISLSAVGSDTNIIMALGAKGTGFVQVSPAAAASRGLVVKGASSQSANLQEWQDNSNNALATVSSAGNFTSPVITASTNFSGPGAASAWVTFTGSTGVIKKSYNVSSVTRSSTGRYILNFSSAMPDTNYGVFGNCTKDTSGTGVVNVNSATAGGAPSNKTVSACALQVVNGNGTLYDPSEVYAQVSAV